MRVVKANKQHFFDVDETLVRWSRNILGAPIYTPHEPTLLELIAAKQRGHHVVVWSAGGWEWADRIVRELNLQNFVDEVRCKPDWYHDDKPADEWMRRCYIK